MPWKSALPDVCAALYLLMDAPSLGIQQASSAAAVARSLDSAQVAARVAVSAVLMQQHPLRDAAPRHDAPQPSPPAPLSQTHEQLPPQMRAEDAGEADAGEADAQPLQQNAMLPAANAASAAAADGQVQQAEAVDAGNSANGGGSRSSASSAGGQNGNSDGVSGSSASAAGGQPGTSAVSSAAKPSADDAAIAVILKAAEQAQAPVDLAACLNEEKGLDKPFSVDDFLKARPARYIRMSVWMNLGNEAKLCAHCQLCISTAACMGSRSAIPEQLSACRSRAGVSSLCYCAPAAGLIMLVDADTSVREDSQFRDRLKVEAGFSSRLSRPATAVTMIVTATMSRQAMIAGLCESYGSVVSLAVYVGMLADDPNAAAAIANSTEAIRKEFDRWDADYTRHVR